MQKLIHVLVVESYGMLISMGFLNDCEVFFAGVFQQTHTCGNIISTSLTEQKKEKS